MAETEEQPIFVIQKHDASQLHYDFRLALMGTLKSWAVPKGPSLNPKDKRLAVQVADHPLGYADFEGIITEGNYGAGSVIVWDTGTYQNIKEQDGQQLPMEDAYRHGQIEVWLNGHKLQGGFALIRMQGQRKNWLLVKMNDEYADREHNMLEAAPASVLTGRTVEEVEGE